MLVTCMAFTFQACSDDDDTYTSGYAEGVYFPDSNSESIDISKDATSFDVTIMRVNTSAPAQTVALTATGTDGLYNVPSSVTFEQGQTTANITITYDGSVLEYDSYTEITLTIADESVTTPYGLSSYTFSVGVPSPWTSLGYCTFSEDFLTTFYSTGVTTYQVEIQENDNTPGYYRLVNPFGAAYPWNEDGDWDDSQDWYLEIHAEDPEGVYIEVQEVGMDWGYGMFSVGSLAGYYMAYGYTLDEMKEAGYTGTLVDGVITFPYATLLISMADYNSGGLYYANYNTGFKIVLPGYTDTDYSLSLAYGGKYTNSDDEDAGVLAIISEVGADAESIQLAVVEGNDYEAAVESVKSGNVTTTEVDAAAGTYMIPFDGTPVDGYYTLVAVTYDGDGVAQDYAYVTFKYASSTTTETWTALYTGDYTYSLFLEGDDPGLTLYQSDSDPTRYKIEHWFYDVDFCFTYDSSTGEILVDDQETGYVHSSYGTVYVGDLVTYTGSTSMGQSYYDSSTGTFYFALIYYVSAGYFGYGYETFTLTGYASDETSAATRASAGKKSAKVTSPKKFFGAKRQTAPKANASLKLFK